MQASRTDNRDNILQPEEGVPGDPVEAELVQIEAARSDPRAFEPLYRHHVGLVYHYALGRLRDPHRAEDATSLTFTRALQALPAFRPKRRESGTTFRSWLMTIARNTVIDAERRQRPTTPLDDRHPASTDSSPEHAVISSSEQERVRDAIARLPETQRQIIELRLVGLKSVEIAEVLDMSPGAVKTANYRAYGRLRKLLGEPDHA